MDKQTKISYRLIIVLSILFEALAWTSVSLQRSTRQAWVMRMKQCTDDNAWRTPDGPKGLAFSQQTPHSGRHFRPSHSSYRTRKLRRRRKRSMEGWYYRLTLSNKDSDGENVSFAIIVSIEDPGNKKSDLSLACIQVVGPDDGYIVQADRDDSKFWAWKHQQGLGCIFEPSAGQNIDRTALSPEDWSKTVKTGFQFLPTHFLGRVNGSRGVLSDGDNPGQCSFDFTIEPKAGWGNQKRTGGWLSNFDVFEPHWQVTLADATAKGTITWNGTTYDFDKANFYAEKNWGAALPPKWYWTQCNQFDNYDELSVTAGGGIRTIPFGRQESLGMIGVHYLGRFYDAVPWAGHMEWDVSTWGSWILRGNSTSCDHPFHVELSYTVDADENPGLVFRAPTPDHGMVYFCRDTFTARTNLSLWELVWDADIRAYVRKESPLIHEATSCKGGAEIGGGPWWYTWQATSTLKEPIKSLLQGPVRARRWFQKIMTSTKTKK